MSDWKDFSEAVNALPVVDTHEHLIPEAERNAQPLDVFNWFSHYASSDAISAGLAADTLAWCRDRSHPLEARWEKFKPFWERIRNTSYAKALLIAARDLFDIPDLTSATYQELSEKLEATRQPGWFKTVLHDKCNIRTAIYCGDHPQLDWSLFSPVYPLDNFLWCFSRQALRGFERQYEVGLHSLADYLALLDQVFEQVTQRGFFGFKLGAAYFRELYFEKPTYADAERLFNRSFEGRGDGITLQEARPLQDFVLQQLLRRVADAGKPLQVHTGLQEGNGNFINNARASHMANLFLSWPEIKFDIFHGSYPYTGELATLAKNFPNVYIDMCWMHVISTYVSKQALHEWLDTVPLNKISAFGGDYLFVEGTYAHCKMARQDVAEVLWARVEEGLETEEEALFMARRLLFDNPRELFELQVSD